MYMRRTHPALWRGSNSVSIQGNTLINIKYDSQTNSLMIFVINTGTSSNYVNIQCGGSTYRDLISGSTYSGNNGFSFNADALTCYIFEVK